MGSQNRPARPYLKHKPTPLQTAPPAPAPRGDGSGSLRKTARRAIRRAVRSWFGGARDAAQKALSTTSPEDRVDRAPHTPYGLGPEVTFAFGVPFTSMVSLMKCTLPSTITANTPPL